jgi:hypothetical protein
MISPLPHVDQASLRTGSCYYGAKMECQDRDEYSGNTAHWFFAFFWLTEGSRNKKINIYIKTENFRSPG